MITDQALDILIDSLKDYKAQGVHDPWFLSDGSVIEPLDALLELLKLRQLTRGWVAIGRKDGVYISDIQLYFDRELLSEVAYNKQVLSKQKRSSS